MKEDAEELLIDLLIKQATYGLTAEETVELKRLEEGEHDSSFDVTTAAIALIDQAPEEMPSHLRSNIRALAERYFDDRETRAEVGSSVSAMPQAASWWNSLGWALAAAACIALVANIYLGRVEQGSHIASGPTPTPAEQKMTPAQERQRLMDSATDISKASWTKGNDKEIASVSGDVVWSDSKQAGYLRLTGLPVNDNSKEQYQLWIFDETQSDKTPIDGGVFDVDSSGEVVVPINAKLHAKNPKMFAITVEKPGGVVVSSREKIAALGKVET